MDRTQTLLSKFRFFWHQTTSCSFLWKNLSIGPLKNFLWMPTVRRTNRTSSTIQLRTTSFGLNYTKLESMQSRIRGEREREEVVCNRRPSLNKVSCSNCVPKHSTEYRDDTLFLPITSLTTANFAVHYGEKKTFQEEKRSRGEDSRPRQIFSTIAVFHPLFSSSQSFSII